MQCEAEAGPRLFCFQGYRKSAEQESLLFNTPFRPNAFHLSLQRAILYLKPILTAVFWGNAFVAGRVTGGENSSIERHLNSEPPARLFLQRDQSIQRDAFCVKEY